MSQERPLVKELKKLSDLHASGFLSDAEFTAAKSRLLETYETPAVLDDSSPPSAAESVKREPNTSSWSPAGERRRALTGVAALLLVVGVIMAIEFGPSLGQDSDSSLAEECAAFQQEADEALDAVAEAMSDPTIPQAEFERRRSRMAGLQDRQDDLRRRGVECPISRK